MVRFRCSACKADKDKCDDRTGHKMSCPVSKYGSPVRWAPVIREVRK